MSLYISAWAISALLVQTTVGNAKASKQGTSNWYRFPRFFFLYGLFLIYFEPSGSGICWKKCIITMTFSEAVKTCLVDKYATFSGRATRSEYWYSVLFGHLLALLIISIGTIVESPELIIVLSSVLTLALLIPGLAVCVRRLHDTGRSGWWYLLVFIPYIGGIAMLVIFCLKSDEDNKYGSKP